MNKPFPSAAVSRSLGLAVLVFAAASTLSAQWPPEIQNLEVLPEDTPIRELIGTMRGFTSALGVRCQYCHIGEEGMPLDQFDFATDTKPAKQTARTMLRMTQTINADYLAGLEREGALEVQCVTCHRGATKPEQLSDLVTRVFTEDGIEAAVGRYEELRSEYYGSGTFDFSERSLFWAAEGLLGRGESSAAVRLLELNLEHHPDSARTLQMLAGAYEQAGREADALATWRQVLEKMPGDPRVLQQIERLENDG